jgi:hypothetical protein
LKGCAAGEGLGRLDCWANESPGNVANVKTIAQAARDFIALSPHPACAGTAFTVPVMAQTLCFRQAPQLLGGAAVPDSRSVPGPMMILSSSSSDAGKSGLMR